MPHSDPDGRAWHIGCGAVLFNLLQAFGRGPTEYVPAVPPLGVRPLGDGDTQRLGGP